MQFTLLLTLCIAATIHITLSSVMFLFSRRRINYLAHAWIMLIISVVHYIGVGFFIGHSTLPDFGIMHPILIVYLLACSFLLSIVPLGLTMPGYLQLGRMCKYATPAVIIISIYIIGALFGSSTVKVYEAHDIAEYFFSGDVLLRFTALVLSSYYIVNQFRLPHSLVKNMELPNDLIAYGSLLGLSSVFLFVISVWFNYVLLVAYIILFTAINLFLTFHIMASVLSSIPSPAIKPVTELPTLEDITISEMQDFNAANQRRFEAIEYIMQHERPYVDSGFNRDRLCRLVGFNRHVALQALRSQGYNDIHEYIVRYRVEELKRIILEERDIDLRTACDRVGFRSLKTAIVSFERYEAKKLVDWHANNSEPSSSEPSYCPQA